MASQCPPQGEYGIKIPPKKIIRRGAPDQGTFFLYSGFAWRGALPGWSESTFKKKVAMFEASQWQCVMAQTAMDRAKLAGLART
jgi:hypothetical protein